jgi:DNA-binding transcriptional LysR family regulator
VRPGTFVSEFFVPRIPKLLERYPGLSVELVMQDHSHDLTENRLDLAMQRGPITNATHVARALRVSRFIVVAFSTPNLILRVGSSQARTVRTECAFPAGSPPTTALLCVSQH